MPSSSHRPRKRFGQHFLHDARVLARIVEAINPAREDFMVEIGPGEGALTVPLLEKLNRLHVVEIDRDLAGRLSDPRIEVHLADALEFDFAQFPEGMRLVGNLPYNISTPLLFHLARCAERVRDMHFMLQLEVVERMVASPSTAQYGRLSVALQARFQMKKLFNVAKGAFRPPPKVESALVRLVPLERPLRVDENLLRKAFSARRKTLKNALPGIDFAALGIDPRLRPENLSPQDYARLSMNSIL
ncbi:MAG: 16S rRNA (adenine(1518)-N(6)/adenine(1519)-N(6))-dimethyltransferase [Betaproteobacteria bacterium RIFCSPLOWO2_12_FULL_65_14]|nr:MAG: 16S rRNA (adenine(1518)-N(6)/adenine(1519)-N(6))-dimethyltransferase [Betaproteobacteria bacterium RIFCSPLOWO2_12_FULL_65_14]